jgi:hypothetical protein
VLVLCEAKYCARECVLYVLKVAQIFIANVLRRNKTELMLLTSATKVFVERPPASLLHSLDHTVANSIYSR